MTDEQVKAAWAWVDRTYCPALAWCLKYLPDLFTLKPALIHDPIMRDVTESGRNVVCAGPREFAKSVITLGAELYDGLNLYRPEQMHVCYDSTLAEHQLGKIIHQLEHNRVLIDAYEIRPGRIQRGDHFEVLVGPNRDLVTFKARGFGGSIRGLHPHRIVLDDIESSFDSPYVWNGNYEELHGTVMGALARTQDAFTGQLVIIGNFLGENCTIKRIMDHDAQLNPEAWVCRSFSALSKHPHGETADLDGKSVWPEFRSTEQLHKIRATMNTENAWAFEREYQNEIVKGVDTIWTREMFKRTWSDLPAPHQMVRRVYIDSAQKIAEGGDRTAIVKLGKVLQGPRVGEYPWLDARLARLSPDEIAAEALRQYVGTGTRTAPECDCVCLESKTSKGEDPLGAYIRLKGRQENCNVNVRYLVPAEHGDKRQRSLKAVPVGQSLALTVPEALTQDMKNIIQEMLMFTGKRTTGVSAIDDGHDAMVWGLIDLKQVEQRPEFMARPVELKHRLRAVA